MTGKIPFYQIFLFVVAFIVLAYVFYDFVKKLKWRTTLQEGMVAEEPFYKEVTTEIGYKELDSKELPSGIRDMPESSQDMELMQYCIKGSANSAYSGQYISDEMVKYVLSRGCRFLDFEVYYLPLDDQTEEYAPYVGYSSDPASVNSTTKNNYLFRKILKSTLANAFTRQSGDKYESPNPKDPLFLHIRLKTDNKMRNRLYDLIHKDINTVFNSGYEDYYLVKKDSKTQAMTPIRVNGNTPMKTLAQKVVFIFDYEPEDYIGTYHNMTSDSAEFVRLTYDEMNTFRYKAMPPKKVDSKRTDVDKFRFAVPDSNRSGQENANIHMAIQNYGVQVTLMQYYITDMGLIRAESLFQQYSAAVLPMVLLLNFIQRNGEGDFSKVSPKLFE